MNMILPPGAIQYQPMIAGMHMTQAEKAANAKRPWTEEEDRCLMDAIQRYGPQRWPLIASFVQRGRAGKQCRERWFNHLCPQVKKGEWTEEEDRLIQEGVNELGTKWSEIVKRLPGRTDNAIKNRYNSQQRRMQRRARAAVVASEATSQAAAAASGESSATVIATATLKRPRPEGTVTVTASAVVDPNKRSAVTVASPRRTQVVTAHLVSTVPASTSGGGVVTAAPVPATQTVQSEVVADSQVVAEGAAPVDAGPPMSHPLRRSLLLPRLLRPLARMTRALPRRRLWRPIQYSKRTRTPPKRLHRRQTPHPTPRLTPSLRPQKRRSPLQSRSPRSLRWR